ncbi:hypothetical protein FRC09_002392 [Ceratobasidium sp. 395]|nr:hypothetical protein FRC09_002392 [Ceratobasidium sp. 395]
MDYPALKRNRTSEYPQFNFSPGATIPALSSVFTELKLARTALTTAIQYYQASCVKVVAACATPIDQSSQHLTAKNVLAAVDSELKSLVSKEGALQQIHVSLLGARKKLVTAIPLINELPAEILADIFALSDSCYMSRHDRTLHNFTSVCTHWRRIALNTTHLWTHIDVGPSVPDGLTKVLLNRTKDTPIYIHLDKSQPIFNLARPKYLAGHRITSTLAPHIHRVHTLEVHLSLESPASFTALLSLWLQKGTPSLAKSLMVYRPVARTLLSFNTPDMDELSGHSANAQAMMRSLSRLHLQNVHFNWDSSVYHGLVDLQLDFGCAPTSVPVSQVADILLASPALTTLKLRSLTITSSDNRPPSTPIVLGRLQLLSLSYIRSDGLKQLLPLLALTDPSAKVYIGPLNFSDIYSEVESLVTRSHIAELYCSHYHHHVTPGVWPSFLRLPGPLSLILHQFPLDELVVRELGPTPSSFPLDVILSDCWVDPQGLKAIVARSNVQSLCLDWCRMPKEDDFDEEGALMSEFDFEEYPDLQAKCSVSEIFLDTRWDHYKIFDDC